MSHQREAVAKETNLVLSHIEGVCSIRCGRCLSHVWHCRGNILVMKFRVGCPALKKTQAYWKVSRRKQKKEI